MKILIVVPRYNDGDYANNIYMFPLGLGYISAVLKQAGHHVKCLNLNHYSGKTDHLVQDCLLPDQKFDFVCTGGLSNSYHQVKAITEAVRSTNTGTGIILGGGMISSEPELMFEALKPDYIVIGEGETTIQELINCIENNGHVKDIEGIGYQDNDGQFQITKKRPPINDLDALPWPDFKGFGFETYLDNMRPTDFFFYDIFDFPRVYPIIGSRGCPFLCSFCFHPLGRKYRQRSIDSIMTELEVMVKKHRINIIAIYDELFTYNQERVLEFCERIKKLISEIPWECVWNCQMRVDGLDEDCLRIMKEAGCHMVSYGFESYSPIVLKSMQKHIEPEQIKQAVKTTLKSNVSLQANFIFGDTAETPQTAKETLDYWKKETDAGIQLGLIAAYPGTKIYQHCIDRGLITNKLDFIANPTEINTADAMNDKDFEQLKYDIYCAELRFRPLTIIDSLKKTSSEQIHGSIKSIYEVSVTCPHCNKLNLYSNYLIQFGKFFFHTRYCRSCHRRFYLVSRLYKIVNTFLTIIFIAAGRNLGSKLYFLSIKVKGRIIQLKPFVKGTIRGISFRPKIEN